MNDFLAGFRMESNDDLLIEKAALKAQRTIYTQQQMGGKSMTRDLRLLEDKLQAVNYVLRERSYVVPTAPCQKSPLVGSVDFSQMQ